MKDKFNFRFKTGDENLVKVGEYFVELTSDNSEIKVIKKRMDNLQMRVIAINPSELETKTVTYDVETRDNPTETSDTITINPSSGKEGLIKAIVNLVNLPVPTEDDEVIGG